jgi:tetratricopeptide (TPR) repeat protein
MAEKSLNDVPRELRMLFARGNDAMQQNNFDYAIYMFGQVLDKDPAFYECRKALRTAQVRKAGGGTGFFKKMLSSAGSSPLLAKGHMALSKDPAEALKIAEQMLNSDPLSAGAHKLVVEAATALEMPKTAVLSLEILSASSPKDRDLAIKFAYALADCGEVSRAEKILSDLYRSFPNDQDLGQALKDVSARKTMDEGGYDALADGKGSYRDILKDKEEAVSLEQEHRQVKTEDVAERLIREYEERLQSEPKSIKLLRSLAELYTQKKDFDRALGYYDQIKSSEVGADASLDRSIADTMVKKFDHQQSLLDPAAPDYAEKAATLQAEKQVYQLAECQKRVERFPTDLQLRFELGQLYFQADKIGEAIQEFQKAQSNPHRRIAAMNYLAQCFAKRKMFGPATRTLEGALKEKLVFDDEKKDLIYNLGCVLEGMGKKDEAIKQFELIYEVDIGYRDVAAKVDAFYASGPNPA